MTERYIEKMSEYCYEHLVDVTDLQPKAREIGYDYLVEGFSLAETAHRHKVTRERVRQIVARIANAK